MASSSTSHEGVIGAGATSAAPSGSLHGSLHPAADSAKSVPPPPTTHDDFEPSYDEPASDFPESYFVAKDFPEMQNRLLLDAALSQEQLPRSPVWVMRQAGRYLPEFRHLRKQHGFFEICRTPHLAAEITLQPTRRYKGLLDAAIIFSDILVIPQAMGMEVEMLPEKGPHFPHPIMSVEEALKLAHAEYDVKTSLAYVYKALTLTRHLLGGQCPLIGFCGAPWTLMAYMIEGGGSKTFIKAKTFLFTHPEESKLLLHKIGKVAADFLVEQIRAGAQLVQIFDSWAGELSPQDFREFELPVLQEMLRIVRQATAKGGPADGETVPVTVFAKGANFAVPLLAASGFDVVGLDWCIDPAAARSEVAQYQTDNGNRTALQGNMDPSLLYAGKPAIEKAVQNMFLGEYGFLSTPEGKQAGHICNLGHGITPNVDPESMRFFLQSVHKYSVRS